MSGDVLAVNNVLILRTFVTACTIVTINRMKDNILTFLDHHAVSSFAEIPLVCNIPLLSQETYSSNLWGSQPGDLVLPC